MSNPNSPSVSDVYDFWDNIKNTHSRDELIERFDLHEVVMEVIENHVVENYEDIIARELERQRLFGDDN